MLARLRTWFAWAGPLRQPLFLLSIFACLGIILSDALPQIRFAVWAVPAALLLVHVWIGKAMLRGLLPLTTTLVFAAAHRANDLEPLREFLQTKNLESTQAMIQGVVSDAPQQDPGGAWQYPVRASQITLSREGAPLGYSGNIYVRTFQRQPPNYGEEILLSGRLALPEVARNPGEFDFREYLHRQSMGAQLQVSDSTPPVVLSTHRGNPVIASAIASRNWLAELVTRDLEDDPDIAATVRAMVLGTRENTPQEIEDAFVASGTMHVFAVSGLHVALFGAVLWAALRVFGLKRFWLVLLTVPIMFFYVYVTGLRPSAWRAAIMAALVLGGPLFNRQGSIFNGIGAAAVLLLGHDSQQLFLPGFQLSFGVLLALAALAAPIMKPLRPIYSADPFLPVSLLTQWQHGWLWWKRKICESFAVSLACTIGSAPLMLYHFKLLTPIGLVANLFIVLLSSALLFAACLSVLSSLFALSWMVPIFNNAAYAFASLAISCAKFFAAVPYGNIHLDPARWFQGSDARITVLAMQNGGAATHLDLPGARWMLDCGSSNAFTRTTRSHLLRYPVTRLDGLILTHGDSSHTGAALALSEAFRPRQLFADTTDVRKFPRAQTLFAGGSLSLGGAATARILWPPAGPQWSQADDRCLVILFECHGWKFLFQNDAGFIAEQSLLESGQSLHADVLIKGRHASDFSGHPNFLQAVNPSAIIYTNETFPAEERVEQTWRDALHATGIALFDQSETGAVEITVSPTACKLRAFTTGQEVRLQR